jgi:hypothetical protein
MHVSTNMSRLQLSLKLLMLPSVKFSFWGCVLVYAPMCPVVIVPLIESYVAVINVSSVSEISSEIVETPDITADHSGLAV